MGPDLNGGEKSGPFSITFDGIMQNAVPAVGNCYVLQIFEVNDDSAFEQEAIHSSRSPSLFPEEDREEREKIKSTLSLEGRSLVDSTLFVCATFERAVALMLDGELLAGDWVSRYNESDRYGKTMELFVSTDRRRLCRIFRTQIY